MGTDDFRGKVPVCQHTLSIIDVVINSEEYCPIFFYVPVDYDLEGDSSLLEILQRL